MSDLFSDVLAVTGRAELEVAPDAAALTVRVSAEAATGPGAHARTAAVAALLDDRLDQLGPAVRQRQTTVLLLAPVVEWGEHGRSTRVAFTAVRDTALEITDVSLLGPLLADLAAHDEIVVHGPQWLVDADNPAHAEVRARAAADARARALDYARGLGLTLGPVAWTTEPGLRTGAETVALHTMSVRSAGHDAGSAALEVSAGTQTVTAALEVGFRLRP